MKKSNVYTRGGDAGMTSLVGGQRVKKNDIRIEAYGTVDELNSVIGLVAACPGIPPEETDNLHYIQNKLFSLGGYLACRPDEGTYRMEPGISEADVEKLEKLTDIYDSRLEPFRTFILPGGSQAAATCHLARTVCRRAERRILDLADTGAEIDPVALKFVNRLSDFLFVLARYNNSILGAPEIFWKKD